MNTRKLRMSKGEKIRAQPQLDQSDFRVETNEQAKTMVGFLLCLSYSLSPLLFLRQIKAHVKRRGGHKKKHAMGFACFLSGRNRGEKVDRGRALEKMDVYNKNRHDKQFAREVCRIYGPHSFF